ncbi:hypothetical protein [Clostridium fungisolvens]|uniref:Lipoprotein n=1 Tax=Clostridium fungisolvens TaxID=1604897 RepID=A0A6V8SE34_9CLOT|nr:hypothetical protein [Clostridium fungisolvens]GFP75477.1 hypothetical protein bsdtw1_01557 [Clostridium fungisolvens]
MRKLLLSLITLILLFSFIGCARNGVSTTTNVLYASMLIYNNTDYYLSSEVVPSENLNKQIETVKKQVTPSPKNNGEANECPVGTKIFSIKGVDSTEAIAVNFHNEYYKAVTKH